MPDWLSTDPEDRRLRRPPLALVVCQVRHESIFAASDAARVLRVKDDLPWASDLEETMRQAVNFSISQEKGISAAHSPGAVGWQLRSPDGQWTASIQPDHFSLETSQYGGWKDFRGKIQALTDSIIKNISPALEHRIGLRFVNQITHPEVSSLAEWRQFISPDIFQGDFYETSGSRMRAAMQVFEIAPSTGRSLVIRHGWQGPPTQGGGSYLLDNDCSRQGSRAMVSEQLMEEADHLHKLALQAFEMETSETLRDYLGREEK
ncbi:TIGR04255 family protein [Kitasatospora purpeofusca]|uniref:TIGR04255 family protein n=1 Tax=Kitasatospora purpeofusca TaxID=67352 RepID=UPI0030F2C54D